MKPFQLKDKYVFHVHSYRCKHAQEIEDEAYVKQAIAMGAEQIVFTDHLPFKDDIFPFRMDHAQFDDYISTLSALKKKYKDQIEINIGVEAEYLPSLHDYYEEIYQMEEIELMVIGQHFFEDEYGIVSFFYPAIQKELLESYYAFENMKAGMKTGFFNVVVHPDRSFRRERAWNEKLENISKELIQVAQDEKIMLEKNLSSQQIPGLYWQEFWQLVPEDVDLVVGSDAHYIEDMYLIHKGSEDKY